MKTCPSCSQVYFDDTLNFCLADGAALKFPNTSDETIVMGLPLPTPISEPSRQGIRHRLAYLAIGLLALVAGGAIVAFLMSRSSAPFENQAADQVVTVDSPRDGYLALKSEPCIAPCGRTLFKIPHGTTLSLGTCKDNFEMADRRRGRWCYTSYAGQTGWVFDGFVTR